MGATEAGLARIAGILKATRGDLSADLDRMGRIDWLREAVATREARAARLEAALARASARARASRSTSERIQHSTRAAALRSALIRSRRSLGRAQALLHCARTVPMSAGYLADEDRYLDVKRSRLGTSIIFTGD